MYANDVHQVSSLLTSILINAREKSERDTIGGN